LEKVAEPKSAADGELGRGEVVTAGEHCRDEVRPTAEEFCMIEVGVVGERRRAEVGIGEVHILEINPFGERRRLEYDFPGVELRAAEVGLSGECRRAEIGFDVELGLCEVGPARKRR
jgi:hypothetical protein